MSSTAAHDSGGDPTAQAVTQDAATPVDPRLVDALRAELAAVGTTDAELVDRLTGAALQAGAGLTVTDGPLGATLDVDGAAALSVAVLTEAARSTGAAHDADSLDARVTELRARVESARTDPENIENLTARELLRRLLGGRR